MEEGAVLNSTPSLRPAMKYKGRIFKGTLGQEHPEVLPDDLAADYYRRGMSGDDLSDYETGFMNHKGQFMDRATALDYGIENGLVSPDAKKYGVLTSPVLRSESSEAGAPLSGLEHEAGEVPKGFHENEDTGSVKVQNMQALDWFAKEGGWNDAQHFLDDHNTTFDKVKGKWFTSLRSQLFFDKDAPAVYQEKFGNIKDQIDDDNEWGARIAQTKKPPTLYSDSSETGAALSALEHEGAQAKPKFAEPTKAPEQPIAQPAPNNIPQIYKPLAEAKPEIAKNIQDFVNLSRDMEKKYGTGDWVSKLTPEDVAAIKADPKYIDAVDKLNGAATEGAFNKILNASISRRSFLTNTAAVARLVASSGKLGKMLESVTPKEVEPILPQTLTLQREEPRSWSELTPAMRKQVKQFMRDEIEELFPDRDLADEPEELPEQYASPKEFYQDYLNTAGVEHFGFDPKTELQEVTSPIDPKLLNSPEARKIALEKLQQEYREAYPAYSEKGFGTPEWKKYDDAVEAHRSLRNWIQAAETQLATDMKHYKEWIKSNNHHKPFVLQKNS